MGWVNHLRKQVVRLILGLVILEVVLPILTINVQQLMVLFLLHVFQRIMGNDSLWVLRSIVSIHSFQTSKIICCTVEESWLEVSIQDFWNVDVAVFRLAWFLEKSRVMATAFGKLWLIVGLMAHHAWMLAVHRVQLNVVFVVHRVQFKHSLMLFWCFDLSRLHLRALWLSFPEQVQLWPIEWMTVIIRCSLSLAQITIIPQGQVFIPRVIASLRDLWYSRLDLDFIQLWVDFIYVWCTLVIINFTLTVVQMHWIFIVVLIYTQFLIWHVRRLPLRGLTFLVSDDWNIWYAGQIVHVIFWIQST